MPAPPVLPTDSPRPPGASAAAADRADSLRFAQKPRRPLSSGETSRWRAVFTGSWFLWRSVFPTRSRGTVVMAAAALMTIVAQFSLIKLPEYIGEITSLLSGGKEGKRPDDRHLQIQLSKAFGCIVGAVVLSRTAELMAMHVGVWWRCALLRKLHALYLSPRAAFRMKTSKIGRSFEQRISSDLNTYIKLACGGVSPPLESVCIGLVHDIFVIVNVSVYIVPTVGVEFLLYSYLYNVLTVIITVYFSLPIPKQTAAQEDLEGSFRVAHARLQEASQRIALLDGGPLELKQLDKRLDKVTTNTRALVFQYFKLEAVTSVRGVGADFFGLSMAVMMTISTPEGVDVNKLVATLGYFRLLSSASQSLPERLPVLSTMAGLSSRLIEVYETLCASQPDAQQTEGMTAVHYSSTQLACIKLSYSIPKAPGVPSRRLATALSFDMREGVRIVVRGESGCGKSSLLRCILGLWEADEGTIIRPLVKDGTLHVMPQRVYMCHGSLRQQVLYPRADAPDVCADEEIVSLLCELGLEATYEEFGLDGVTNWEDVLSVGEQQRIAFARLLLARPRFVIMDEATSALDPALEVCSPPPAAGVEGQRRGARARAQERCMQRVVDAKIACLTVAHRPSLLSYHDQILEFQPDGSATLTPVEPDVLEDES